MPRMTGAWTLSSSPLPVWMFQREDRGWRSRVRYDQYSSPVLEHRMCPSRCHTCMQQSNLFFTAVAEVKTYVAMAGHLPVVVSENVQGRRWRRHGDEQVSNNIGTAVWHADIVPRYNALVSIISRFSNSQIWKRGKKVPPGTKATTIMLLHPFCVLAKSLATFS
jgi:hypothetical protein